MTRPVDTDDMWAGAFCSADWNDIEGCVAFALTVARTQRPEDDPRVVSLRELLNRVIRVRGV